VFFHPAALSSSPGVAQPCLEIHNDISKSYELAIVLFWTLANCDDWEEIQAFAVYSEDLFCAYLELPNGIPSKDMIRRVMGMVDPDGLQAFQLQWNEMLSTGEGEKLKKIINIDGKTMRDSGNKHQNPWHVVSAWSKEDGICFGQAVVGAKENEIVAIPQLIETLNIKDGVILFERAVRGHWAIESMHWHLDVIFHEDFNATLDKQAALNLNSIRKLCLIF